MGGWGGGGGYLQPAAAERPRAVGVAKSRLLQSRVRLFHDRILGLPGRVVDFERCARDVRDAQRVLHAVLVEKVCLAVPDPNLSAAVGVEGHRGLVVPHELVDHVCTLDLHSELGVGQRHGNLAHGAQHRLGKHRRSEQRQGCRGWERLRDGSGAVVRCHKRHCLPVFALFRRDWRCQEGDGSRRADNAEQKRADDGSCAKEELLEESFVVVILGRLVDRIDQFLRGAADECCSHSGNGQGRARCKRGRDGGRSCMVIFPSPSLSMALMRSCICFSKGVAPSGM